MTRLLAAFIVAGLAATVHSGFASASRTVPYPQGYRTWTHVKSMAILSKEHPLFDAFGGIHHIYVNNAGREALKAGKPLPDGTVLVFDLLEADQQSGAATEGARRFVGVMQRDRRAWAATGGWGFEGFKGDSRTERMVQDPAAQCFGCHRAQEASGYTFTLWRP